MGLKLNVTGLALLVLFASHANAQIFDVTAKGAKPNADSTQVSTTYICMYIYFLYIYIYIGNFFF